MIYCYLHALLYTYVLFLSFLIRIQIINVIHDFFFFCDNTEKNLLHHMYYNTQCTNLCHFTRSRLFLVSFSFFLYLYISIYKVLRNRYMFHISYIYKIETYLLYYRRSIQAKWSYRIIIRCLKHRAFDIIHVIILYIRTYVIKEESNDFFR